MADYTKFKVKHKLRLIIKTKERHSITHSIICLFDSLLIV